MNNPERKEMGLPYCCEALGLLLSLLLLRILSGEINNVVIVTAVFVLIAYVGPFLLSCRASTKVPTAGMVYMVLQIPICIVFGLFSRIIPFWVAFVVQAVVAIVAWRRLTASPFYRTLGAGFGRRRRR